MLFRRIRRPALSSLPLDEIAPSHPRTVILYLVVCRTGSRLRQRRGPLRAMHTVAPASDATLAARVATLARFLERQQSE